ncbi:MAG TPA: UvrB/UvrC motif-containing protein, partial [Kiritimatiellia bacterium]|nr:UvrB/UvrC motif-containing protein [Kiritimatiellia bacterium]HQQ04888.1 UvrB/UvrC motif-containing protein [Kiritimatiellia bacterium]
DIMLCDRCKENDATVHLTQVVNGVVEKLHLCESCAAEAGFDLQGPVSITDILLGMGAKQDEAAEHIAEKICPDCHMTMSDFKKCGRLGCARCYEIYRDELGLLLKAVHRSEQHTGKIPARDRERVHHSQEAAALQKELADAVAREDYEEAARLRDRLRMLADHETR